MYKALTLGDWHIAGKSGGDFEEVGHVAPMKAEDALI